MHREVEALGFPSMWEPSSIFPSGNSILEMLRELSFSHLCNVLWKLYEKAAVPTLKFTCSDKLNSEELGTCLFKIICLTMS